jgi:DNA-binding XRE family transcriptional regulator
MKDSKNMAEADKSRQLTAAQDLAISRLVSGGTDSEAAEVAGVTRQTVNAWKNSSAAFQAELFARRQAVWQAQEDRLRWLLSVALDVLEGELEAKAETLEARKRRLQVAVHVLRASGLYGVPLAPIGTASVEEIETDKAEKAREQAERRLFASHFLE